MKSIARFLFLLCLFFVSAYSSIGAAPVRVFYDVGPVTYEVSEFKKGLPVLDTPVEGDVKRARFEGKWSYSGDLTVDAQLMSMVYPYRIRQEPKIYSNREKPAAHYVHLHPGFANSLGWKTEGKNENLAIFGWLVDEEVRNIMVTTPKAFSRFSSYLKMEGSGIDRSGVLVAWSIDESGNLIPLDTLDNEEGAVLRMAAMNGDLEELTKLTIGNPKTLNVKDSDERTLLMHAALGGRTEVAKYLLEQGGKGFEEDVGRAGALDIAAENGWLEIVRSIASKKPKGTKQKLQYSVAAVNAYNARHQEIAIHLMELGASVNLSKKLAPEKTLGLFSSECVQLARWIQEEYKVNGSYSKDGVNFLHATAGYADLPLLDSLKANGASLTEKATKGVSPLLMACEFGNRNAICWFMENGGRTDGAGDLDPVMHAISKGENESVSCLIDYGVNVNREEKKGISPLMFACSLGKKEIAETLMDAGGLWLFESKYHDLALRQLLRLNSPKLIEGLFAQDLSADYKMYGAIRLVEIADFFDSDEVATVLRNRMSDGSSRLVSVKDLAVKPEVARRSNVDYPFSLQEKYGDVDVLLKVGVAKSGAVGAVEVDDRVPEEIGTMVENALYSWVFKPLVVDDDESLVVVKFKLPLRMSIREKDIFEMRNLSEFPRAIYQVEPRYPRSLSGVKGYVELEWIIDEQGIVRFAKVVESSHRGFEESALASTRLSRWKPGKNNGVPVAVRVKQRMDFNPH